MNCDKDRLCQCLETACEIVSSEGMDGEDKAILSVLGATRDFVLSANGYMFMYSKGGICHFQHSQTQEYIDLPDYIRGR